LILSLSMAGDIDPRSAEYAALTSPEQSHPSSPLPPLAVLMVDHFHGSPSGVPVLQRPHRQQRRRTRASVPHRADPDGHRSRRSPHAGIGNATSEGINRVVKLEARNACGFRNPVNQRLRAS
jgi:hypothetical protein